MADVGFLGRLGVARFRAATQGSLRLICAVAARLTRMARELHDAYIRPTAFLNSARTGIGPGSFVVRGRRGGGDSTTEPQRR